MARTKKNRLIVDAKLCRVDRLRGVIQYRTQIPRDAVRDRRCLAGFIQVIPDLNKCIEHQRRGGHQAGIYHRMIANADPHQ